MPPPPTEDYCGEKFGEKRIEHVVLGASMVTLIIRRDDACPGMSSLPQRAQHFKLHLHPILHPGPQEG